VAYGQRGFEAGADELATLIDARALLLPCRAPGQRQLACEAAIKNALGWFLMPALVDAARMARA